MCDKPEKGSEKGILARTATYTTKKARRAQTKLKQRVGKGDETKDEVFDEFVQNFNKQQASALRLQTELKNYLRCISAMQVAATNFSEAVKEIYEEDWTSRDKLVQHFNESDSNWTTLSKRLTEEVLEPLLSYQKPFSDVKSKIQKRARKLVDYDHARHTVDTLRAKGATKSSDAKKLNQAEDDYQKARDIFVELTSDLYEELPALFDSRIGFYVSCFQSIFTLEEVFHRDASKIEHQLNDLMDQLITDFSAGTYSTRKPFSAGLETTSNSSEKVDEDMENGGLAQFYDVAVPTSNDSNENFDNIDSTTNATPRCKQTDDDDEEDKEVNMKNQPTRPAPLPPHLQNTTEVAPMKKSNSEENVVDLHDVKKNESENMDNTDGIPTDSPPPYPTDKTEETSQPTPSTESSSTTAQTDTNTATTAATATATTTDGGVSSVIAYKNTPSPDNPNKCNLIVPASLYKVVTTHQYAPEDDDELAFEKGEIIHVIPFDDPDEQDDGWLMGVMDSSGLTGVFPENFTKKHAS